MYLSLFFNQHSQSIVCVCERVDWHRASRTGFMGNKTEFQLSLIIHVSQMLFHNTESFLVWSGFSLLCR